MCGARLYLSEERFVFIKMLKLNILIETTTTTTVICLSDQFSIVRITSVSFKLNGGNSYT